MQNNPEQITDNTPISIPDADEEARSELISSLIPDLPLLMYGSGDVEPANVSQSTTYYLAELTANYVRDLVKAAVDAHDILTGESGEGILPPVSPTQPKGDESNQSNSKKRTRSSQASIWETNEDLYSNKSSEVNNVNNWDASNNLPYNNNRYSSAQASKLNNYNTSKMNLNSTSSMNNYATQTNQKNPMDWTGLQGADFYQNHRYNAKVKRPKSGLYIQTRSFLFPICHDKELYGKVKDIQSKRRQMLPELLDPVLLDMMKEECQNNERDNNTSRNGATNSDLKASSSTGPNGASSNSSGGPGASTPAKYAVAKGVHGFKPTWPESDSVLPVYLEELE